MLFFLFASYFIYTVGILGILGIWEFVRLFALLMNGRHARHNE